MESVRLDPVPCEERLQDQGHSSGRSNGFAGTHQHHWQNLRGQRRCSQALHSGEWWDGGRQQQGETQEAEAGGKEKPFPQENTVELGSGEFHTPTGEVLSTVV